MASARRVGTNENVQTYGDGTRDFTSLSAWESVTDNDLVTAMVSEVLECFDDAVFDDTVNLQSAITDSSFFRIIRAASGEGHDGTPNTGVRFASTSGTFCLRSREANDQFQDLVVSINVSDAGEIFGIGFGKDGNGLIVGCIIHDVVNSGAGTGVGLRYATDEVGCVSVDCLVIDCDNDGFRQNNANTGYLYNCTFIGNTDGVRQAFGALVVKNCLSSGNVTADFSGTFDAVSIANISSDTTAPGIGPLISQSVAFVDAASNDYHLAATSVARGRGVDLSADATFAFDDDIDGFTIPTNSWAIGFDWITPSVRRQGVAENVQTYGDGTRDFTSLSVWEAATDNDLVTATISEVLECFDDSAEFTDRVSLSGAITNGSFFRIIRPAPGQRHDGTPNTGVKFTNTTSPLFGFFEANAKVQDVVGTLSLNSVQTANVFYMDPAGDQGEFVGCISNKPTNIGAGFERSFFNEGADDGVWVDCLAIEGERGFEISAGNQIAYNCISVDVNQYGFLLNGVLTFVVKNCLADNAATADFIALSGTFDADSVTNASSDGTAPGMGSRISQTFTFVNAAGDDYHLDPNDGGARNFGTNLTEDTIFAFDDDIDGVLFGVWDIGFDEVGALSTRDERTSAIGIDLIFARVYPDPDGSLASLLDLLHMALSYRFGGGAVPAPGHTYQHQGIDMGNIGFTRRWSN